MSHHSAQNKKYKLPDKKQANAKAAPAPNAAALFLENKPWLYVILLFLLVSIIYFPVAFEKKAPPASDTIQWQGSAHRVIEYNKTHSDRALWQPNMFSGMPSYLISLPLQYPFVENITKVVDHIMNWRIFLLFLGGLGIFLLLRMMKLEAFTAFFGAVVFMFCCHWTGLLDIGHNTKFRAVMWIPWVIWGLMYLKEKRNLLGLGMTSVFLIAQLRENHPQISYYMYLFIGMFWIFSLVDTFKNKEWGKLLTFTMMLVGAFVFMGLAVMNPFLSTWEYGHYTIRGGSSGLDKAYAQGWSFPPAEIISFIIPDFFGGINQTYWGGMEFTQIYNYSGVLVLALAFFALAGKRKRLAWFLWISSIVFLIMSFGKYGGFISDLLLKYLPYFNKFRVPSMILVMVQFSLAILAAFGIEAIVEMAKKSDPAQLKKFKTWYIAVIVLFVLFLILGKSIFKGLPFTNENEIAQLKAQNAYGQLDSIKAIRLGMLYKSGALSLLFLFGGMSFIFLYLRKNINKAVFFVLILVLAFIDLWIYTGKNLQNVESPQYSQANQTYTKKDYDDFLLGDKENFRIYPLNVGMNGQWAYYHQTIQGYHGAKLKRYQEVLENCLDSQLRQQKINWNLLNMLNVKYVLFPDSLPFPNLQPVFSSNEEQVVVHRNLSALPRAWFVDSVKELKMPKVIWGEINSEQFNPIATALVEEPVKDIGNPVVRNVKPLSFDMHNISFETKTDKQAFLVVSEVFYPAGWKAFIDGKETKIYPTDYILRGIVVPAGKHKVEMKFAPESYKLSIRLSAIGLSISLLALLAGLYLWYKSRRKEDTPAA